MTVADVTCIKVSIYQHIWKNGWYRADYLRPFGLGGGFYYWDFLAKINFNNDYLDCDDRIIYLQYGFLRRNIGHERAVRQY